MSKAALKSSRSLFADALSDFWRWKWPLAATVAVIALPLTLLGVIASLNQDPTFSAYSSFLTLVMNLALLWVIVRKVHNQPVTIRDAYYEGTAPLVKFLLVAVLLALMLIPFAFGALVYVNGVTGATLVASTSEKMILGLVWAVFALPSLLLISRFVLSIYAVIEPGATPLASMRRASQLVKGRTWRVTGRLAALAIVSLFILTVPTVIATSAGTSTVASIGLAAVQLLSTLIILPVSNLYLYRLYEALSA